MRRLLLLLALVALPAWSATVYVDAATGDDGDDGSTEGLAKATVAAGVVAAGDGGIVYIKGGTDYTESVTLDANESISLIGYSSTITDGGMAVIDASGETYGLTHVSTGSSVPRDTITFANLEVKNATSHGVNSQPSGSSYALYAVINCYVHSNGGYGVYCTGTYDRLYVARSTIASNGSVGLRSIKISVADSYVFENTNDGIYGYNTTVNVYRTAFVHNGDNGIEVDGDGMVNATLCTFDQNVGDGIVGSNTCAIVVDGCIFTENVYGFDGTVRAVISRPYYGTGAFAQSSGNDDVTNYDVGASVAISADPWTARYDSSTNPTATNWDYRVGSSAAIFDVSRYAGHVGGTGDAYTSIGPKVQNVAGGSGAIIIAPRRHGN